MIFRNTASLVLLLIMAVGAGPALAQNQTPANSGPSAADKMKTLDATMRFIQDTLNNQGTVAFVWTMGLGESRPTTMNNSFHVYGAVADAASCTLRRITTLEEDFLSDHGHVVMTTVVPLRELYSVLAESGQDWARQTKEYEAHTPEFYVVALRASKPVIKKQTTTSETTDDPNLPVDPPLNINTTEQIDGIFFPDKDAADRIAQPLALAVRLCGGGQKGPS
ncbi:MAG TPA: hypothetical protein VK828_09785 [Terriglobales bacterium]|jgi:hypothetical protein|nr:hypothetical protein [Terriglobales bacterium]